MLTYPTIRLVFDRKHVASKTTKGLIQIEIMHERKRKWVSTGVKVYADQWNERASCVVGANDQIELNERINLIKGEIHEWVNTLIREKRPFSWQELNSFLAVTNGEEETFIDFIARRIEERADIRDSSRKAQRRIMASLREFGRIVTFADLTRANIQDYYDWLLARKISKAAEDGTTVKVAQKQSNAWGYMKILRTYIHDAVNREIIPRDPSAGIKVKRGESESGRWLTDEELDNLWMAQMPDGSLSRVRDLFIFMCETGLSYSDAMSFRASEVLEEDGLHTYEGKRIKTGESYFFALTPRAREILRKYDMQLPIISNQQFNLRLKAVASAAGIDKPIATHYARRTCGRRLLNAGFSIEQVAKVLGHKDIKTTQHTYAEILNENIVMAYKKIGLV